MMSVATQTRFEKHCRNIVGGTAAGAAGGAAIARPSGGAIGAGVNLADTAVTEETRLAWERANAQEMQRLNSAREQMRVCRRALAEARSVVAAHEKLLEEASAKVTAAEAELEAAQLDANATDLGPPG